MGFFEPSVMGGGGGGEGYSKIYIDIVEIVKCGFWRKLPLFDHFCGAPMQIIKISDFPIYPFTNDLLP